MLEISTAFLIKVAIAIALFVFIMTGYNWGVKRIFKVIESTSSISGYTKRMTSLKYIVAIMRVVVIFIYIIFLFMLFEIPGSTFVSFLGLAGVAVSLLLREVLLDYVFGFLLLLEGNIKIDDEVSVEGFKGTVEIIELRTSRIRDGVSGDVFVVSNRHFTKFIKKKDQKGYVVEATIQAVAYEDVAKRIKEHYTANQNVKKIDVLISKYNADKMEIQVLADVKNSTYKQIRQEILQIINEV